MVIFVFLVSSMKKVLSAREVEELLKQSRKIDAELEGAILTPAARDLLRSDRSKKAACESSAPKGAEPVVPDYEYKWTKGSDPKTGEEMESFFSSSAIETLKERLVDIGRRLWERNYVDGNGGNITIRVGDNLVLCTPTLISKGFMNTEEMCLVDFEGNQLAGSRKRTSEVNTHIGIMRRQSKAKSCVHAHPVHATAFAVASVEPPTCMIPEAEVFLGKIGLAKYRTPGTKENADEVGRVGVDHNAVLMENHGVITWGKDVEDAYWKMENTDAYCQTVWIASQLGRGLSTFSPLHLKELIEVRKRLGMEDPRSELRDCELCDNSEFRPSVVCRIPVGGATGGGSEGKGAVAGNIDLDELVRRITDSIMKGLG